MKIEIINKGSDPTMYTNVKNYEVSGNFMRIIFNDKADNKTVLEHSKLVELGDVKSFNVINDKDNTKEILNG